MQLDPKYNPFGPNVVCWERGQYAGRSRPLNRDVLFKNLIEIHEVFDEFGLRHWLSHGTMLGVYRDGDFIAWDDDADIGMDYSQRSSKEFKLAMDELVKRGFYIPPSDPKKPVGLNNAPYYDMVAIRDGEKVEGWCFEKFDDFYIYDKPRCGNTLKHPAKYYDELKTFNFKGVEFKIPNHVEDWLVFMYGKNWNIPDKNRKYNQQS